MEYRDDFQVKCPFYLKQNQTSIMCEGSLSDVTNHNLNIFRDQAKKKTYMNCYCKNKYKECEVYKSIYKKYDENVI